MRLLQLTSLLIGGLLAATPLAAQQPTPRTPPRAPAGRAPAPAARTPAPAAPATTGYLQGVALDSINDGPLINALVQVEGTSRVGVTDSLGRFTLDSVPPGSYRVLLDHPILDTLGITLATQPMSFAVNEVTRVVVAVPGGEFLAARFCPAARRALGPGVLVGRVREPDSEVAAKGARVSLVWYDPDPVGLPIAAQVKVNKAPRVRETTVGEDGTYRLCGLPTKFEGKLQAQRKDGGVTAEVAVSQDERLLTLRSMSVAPLAVASAAGATPQQQRGSARVSGRVTNNVGAPVANARVGLMGHSAATVTRANGEFVLDSLPAGTQSLIVRQIGYAPTEVAVELSARAPQRVTVKMGAYVPELTPVEVVSRRDEGLERVGFSTRKRLGASGYFMTPEQIEARKATYFTDLLNGVPSLRVQGSLGRTRITSTRGAGSGCVNVFVDGSRWQQMDSGDLDAFLQPGETSAIEVYSGGSIPVEFTTGGQDCSVVVIWTKTRVLRTNKR